MCALVAEAAFDEGDDLVKVAAVFVEADEAVEFFGVDDNVEAADAGEAELFLLDAGGVDFLPCLDVVCL